MCLCNWIHLMGAMRLLGWICYHCTSLYRRAYIDIFRPVCWPPFGTSILDEWMYEFDRLAQRFCFSMYMICKLDHTSFFSLEYRHAKTHQNKQSLDKNWCLSTSCTYQYEWALILRLSCSCIINVVNKISHIDLMDYLWHINCISKTHATRHILINLSFYVGLS